MTVASTIYTHVLVEPYQQLDSFIQQHSHDNLIIPSNFNAVTGCNRQVFEDALGPCGSRCPIDKSSRLLSVCIMHKLAVVGSWFKRGQIHRSTWVSPDGKTTKEIDHMLISKLVTEAPSNYTGSKKYWRVPSFQLLNASSHCFIRSRNCCWKEGIIILLYKGKGQCSSDRPVTLLFISGKVFVHVLLGMT